MAATSPIIYRNVSVNGTEFSLHLTEGAEVTIEPVTDPVEDNQTLVSAYDVTFSVTLYDANVATDANIYSNTAGTPVRANMLFSGAVGAANTAISNVIVNATKVYDQNRVGFTLTGSKRVTSLAEATTDS